MEETAFAKINLALHVRARKPDGYHHIETLFAFVEHGDRLSAAAAKDIIIETDGPFADSLPVLEDNIVARAVDQLRRDFGVTEGIALRLDKRLPIAAGLGGGSADAAATLRLLSRFWDLPAEKAALLEIARGLGSDVPACLVSQMLRGEGRGDQLTPVGDAGIAGTPILLVNPRIALPTARVFAAWDGVDRGPLPEGDAWNIALAGRNDLELAARLLAPPIGEVLEMLVSQSGSTLVRMSGSGATCFALFEDQQARDSAAAAIAAQKPEWWQLASRIRVCEAISIA